jgi:hypothetical protein
MQEPSRFERRRAGLITRGSETLCGEVIDPESVHLVKALRRRLAAAGAAAAGGGYFPYSCDP